MASRIIALERVEDCHGQRQRPWWTEPMVFGLVVQKKIGVRWNLLMAVDHLRPTADRPVKMYCYISPPQNVLVHL